VLTFFDDQPPPAGPPGFEVLPPPRPAVQGVDDGPTPHTELPPMTIRVKLFAILRERAGTSEVSLALGDGATVADASAELVRRVPTVATHVDRAAYAVNMSYVDRATILHDGDELALIPPVSGG
jgi:molybdopterin converting factor subunit 1